MEDRTATSRIVLVEFKVAGALLEQDAAVKAVLEEQLGDEDGNLPERVVILVPVARADGGRLSVIERTARSGGIYRAPPLSGWGGKRAVPPSQQAFDFEDVD